MPMQDIDPPGDLPESAVPTIALIDEPGEPGIDRANEIGEPHPRALREVSELVGKNATQFPDGQPSDQGQTDREGEFVAHQPEVTARKAGRGIHPQIDGHPPRARGTDLRADLVDERKQPRLLLPGHLGRRGALHPASEERLDH